MAVHWLEGVEARLIARRREKRMRGSTSARIFSVHAQPAEVEAETQVFSLRQNLKQGCNIAYDGGSNQTIVTEEYAKRKGLKRIGGAAAAFGLGEAEATVGDMYMVTICDRNLKVHYLEALAVPYIYTGPAATCPKNLRTRFMRTYTPLPKELHQTGAATDVCA